jgi:hypothetical protein
MSPTVHVLTRYVRFAFVCSDNFSCALTNALSSCAPVPYVRFPRRLMLPFPAKYKSKMLVAIYNAAVSCRGRNAIFWHQTRSEGLRILARSSWRGAAVSSRPLAAAIQGVHFRCPVPPQDADIGNRLRASHHPSHCSSLRRNLWRAISFGHLETSNDTDEYSPL